MKGVTIVLVCILAAVGYGIVHDQITVRVCLEYFTIGHAPIFATDDPTLLGLCWGVVATWWAGAILGLPLALAARLGARPRRSPRSLVRPVGRLLGVMALCAALAGLVGYVLGGRGTFVLREPLASQVPRDRHARFLADLWAHDASYVVGFVGGLTVIVSVWRSRGLERPVEAPVVGRSGEEGVDG